MNISLRKLLAGFLGLTLGLGTLPAYALRDEQRVEGKKAGLEDIEKALQTGDPRAALQVAAGLEGRMRVTLETIPQPGDIVIDPLPYARGQYQVYVPQGLKPSKKSGIVQLVALDDKNPVPLIAVSEIDLAQFGPEYISSSAAGLEGVTASYREYFAKAEGTNLGFVTIYKDGGQIKSFTISQGVRSLEFTDGYIVGHVVLRATLLNGGALAWDVTEGKRAGGFSDTAGDIVTIDGISKPLPPLYAGLEGRIAPKDVRVLVVAGDVPSRRAARSLVFSGLSGYPIEDGQILGFPGLTALSLQLEKLRQQDLKPTLVIVGRYALSDGTAEQVTQAIRGIDSSIPVVVLGKKLASEVKSADPVVIDALEVKDAVFSHVRIRLSNPPQPAPRSHASGAVAEQTAPTLPPQDASPAIVQELPGLRGSQSRAEDILVTEDEELAQARAAARSSPTGEKPAGGLEEINRRSFLAVAASLAVTLYEGLFEVKDGKADALADNSVIGALNVEEGAHLTLKAKVDSAASGPLRILVQKGAVVPAVLEGIPTVELSDDPEVAEQQLKEQAREGDVALMAPRVEEAADTWNDLLRHYKVTGLLLTQKALIDMRQLSPEALNTFFATIQNAGGLVKITGVAEKKIQNERTLFISA